MFTLHLGKHEHTFNEDESKELLKILDAFEDGKSHDILLNGSRHVKRRTKTTYLKFWHSGIQYKVRKK